MLHPLLLVLLACLLDRLVGDPRRCLHPVQVMGWAIQALRSAIILDAADGSISGAGIMSQLPVDFRIDNSTPFDGQQNVAAQSNCKDAQCTSLFSWFVFLPAQLASR